MVTPPPSAAEQVARILRERQREALLRQLHDLADADHAEEGPADEPPPRTTLVGLVRQLRLGRQVAPLGVIGLLWSAGAVAHVNPAAAALYLAVAIVLWWWTTRGRPRRMRRGYRTIITVGGSVWLAVATSTGAGVWQTAVLVAGGYALAAPHWYEHRIPIPAEPEPEPEPEPEIQAPEFDPVVVLWDRRVAASGALAGARLVEREVMPAGGLKYLIELVPGRQTSETAYHAARMIASALDRSMAEVSVDEHPSGNQNLAVLMLTGKEDNVLARLNPHPGFDVAYDRTSGYAGIGIHADSEWARWALCIPDWGLAGGAVFGDIGSGKSRFLDMIAAQAAHTGVLSVWAGDPTGGGAIPAILRHCAWPARNPDEILLQLRAMSTAIDWRIAANGLFDRPLHVPSPAEPGILLILDELHKVTGDKTWPGRPEAIRLLRKVATEGRKAAVAAIVADQGPGLHNFGDSPEMRSGFWTKNAVCFRLSARESKDTINGLEANPATLPKRFPDGSPTGGLGYLVGARIATLRTWMLDDPAAALAAASLPDLDELLANAIGDPWHNRRALAADSKASLADQIAAFSPELVAQATAQDPELAAALARFRAHPTPTTDPAAVPAPNLVTYRLPAAPRFAEPTEPDALKTPGARRIYDLICAGVTSPADLIVKSGLSSAHVHDQLTALTDAGLITRRRRGVYERAA